MASTALPCGKKKRPLSLLFISCHLLTGVLKQQQDPPAYMVALGLLTGVSYQSGLDYYKNINEQYMQLVPKGKLMPPNPSLVMVSVDCDEYASMLVAKEWDAVSQYLSRGVERLVKAEPDCCLVICSNTAHLAVPLVRQLHPTLPILHIADVTARATPAEAFKTAKRLVDECPATARKATARACLRALAHSGCRTHDAVQPLRRTRHRPCGTACQVRPGMEC